MSHMSRIQEQLDSLATQERYYEEQINERCFRR